MTQLANSKYKRGVGIYLIAEAAGSIEYIDDEGSDKQVNDRYQPTREGGLF